MHIFDLVLEMNISGESTQSILPWAKQEPLETESSDLIIKKFADFVNDMNITKIDLLKSVLKEEISVKICMILIS